jgi:hypothetical protein
MKATAERSVKGCGMIRSQEKPDCFTIRNDSESQRMSPTIRRKAASAWRRLIEPAKQIKEFADEWAAQMH